MLLLELPLEIRENIYHHVLQEEQEDKLQYVGTGREGIPYDFCIPLRTIRPPALGRVGRATRCEYLPIFFKATCFRLCVNIQPARQLARRHLRRMGTGGSWPFFTGATERPFDRRPDRECPYGGCGGKGLAEQSAQV